MPLALSGSVNACGRWRSSGPCCESGRSAPARGGRITSVGDRAHRARIRHERSGPGEFHRLTRRNSYLLARSAHLSAPLRITVCRSAGAIEPAIAAGMYGAVATGKRLGTARIRLPCLSPSLLPRGHPCGADSLRPAVLAAILVHGVFDS